MLMWLIAALIAGGAGLLIALLWRSDIPVPGIATTLPPGDDSATLPNDPVGSSAPTAQPTYVDICEEGVLVSALTVSTAGGVAEFPEEGGALFGDPWRSFNENEWDALYGDLWEYGPNRYALEASFRGEPGTRVCFRMIDEWERREALLGSDSEPDPNTSMQWAYVFESPLGNRLDDYRANATYNMKAHTSIGDDGTLLIRWREGGNGTSATYTLATLEIWVEAGKILQTG